MSGESTTSGPVLLTGPSDYSFLIWHDSRNISGGNAEAEQSPVHVIEVAKISTPASGAEEERDQIFFRVVTGMMRGTDSAFPLFKLR